jgi:hypothetical protein
VTYNEGKPYIGVEAQKIISRFPKSTITDLKSVLRMPTSTLRDSFSFLALSLEQVKGSKLEFQQSIVESKTGTNDYSFLFFISLFSFYYYFY